MSKHPERPYRLLDSKSLYEGHIIRLVEDRFVLGVSPDKVVTRELVIHWQSTPVYVLDNSMRWR